MFPEKPVAGTVTADATDAAVRNSKTKLLHGGLRCLRRRYRGGQSRLRVEVAGQTRRRRSIHQKDRRAALDRARSGQRQQTEEGPRLSQLEVSRCPANCRIYSDQTLLTNDNNRQENFLIYNEFMVCPFCRSDKLRIKHAVGMEMIILLFTSKRKYRCCDCNFGFRAPDRRRVPRQTPDAAKARVLPH
jgi:hypothetical protein